MLTYSLFTLTLTLASYQAHFLLLACGRKEPGSIGGFKLLTSSYPGSVLHGKEPGYEATLPH